MDADLPVPEGGADDGGRAATGIDLGQLAALANDFFRTVPGHDVTEPLPTARACCFIPVRMSMPCAMHWL